MMFSGLSGLGAQDLSGEAARVEMLLKLCTANRGYAAAGIDTFRIAIVYDRTDSASTRLAIRYRDLIGQMPELPFRSIPNAISLSAATASDSLDWPGLHAVIGIPGDAAAAAALLAKCNVHQVLSLTTSRELFERGFAIGVYMRPDQQPEIWFNIPVLKNEGAIYTREILELVTQVFSP